MRTKFDFEFSKKTSSGKVSNFIFGTPLISLNPKLLNNLSKAKGVFLHELGHVYYPPKNIESRIWYWAFAKLFIYLQLIFIPIQRIIVKNLNLDLNYFLKVLIVAYIFKLFFELIFYPVMKWSQEDEYLADAFSFIYDPNKYQLTDFKKNIIESTIIDITLRLLPIYVFKSHPITLLRIKKLENKEYVNKILPFNQYESKK